MSAKMSEARRAAFFAALRETGNQSLAAEAAKVSRSWVALHRANDADFRRELEAALRQARDRLDRHPERRPPSGWGYLDGEELVVKGSGGPGGGRRVQIARARLRQWTPRIEERFLAALMATGNVGASLAEAGMSKGSAYAHRKRWPGFARRWDEAVAFAEMQLGHALVHHAANPFSGRALPEPDEVEIVAGAAPARAPPRPVHRLTPDQALHNLHMHQHQVRGFGGRPGRQAEPMASGEAARIILAKVEAIERAAGLSEAQKAQAEREYERRRPGRRRR